MHLFCKGKRLFFQGSDFFIFREVSSELWLIGVHEMVQAYAEASISLELYKWVQLEMASSCTVLLISEFGEQTIRVDLQTTVYGLGYSHNWRHLLGKNKIIGVYEDT